MGSRQSLRLGPREWAKQGCPGQGTVWPEAGRGTFGPLEHRCSATAWELVPNEMGRLWEDRWSETTVGPAQLLSRTLCLPGSLVSFAAHIQVNPSCNCVKTLLWVPTSQVLSSLGL